MSIKMKERNAKKDHQNATLLPQCVLSIFYVKLQKLKYALWPIY